MIASSSTIHLTLLSHTNAGKTTLARTLLRQDIGEVGDRAHVTEAAERHRLIETPEGDALDLWDTPGFGDSARLFRRLERSGNPLGWVLSQVWDRLVDRPFFCSQQAMRAARETSDVVLYVVNAGESPASAAYVEIEMRIVEWLQKPVLLLLNQLGPSREAAELERDVAQWREHLARFPQVRAVLPFDAFARCWVQEGRLLDEVRRVLPASLADAGARLRAAWLDRNLGVFESSMRVLAAQLAEAAADLERLDEPTAAQKARAWIGSLGATGEPRDPAAERAQQQLAGRLDRSVRAATESLVQLHGLAGRASEEVLKRIGREFAIERPTDVDRASVVGGLVSGALGGLAADLAAGGLTFGAGALIGGVLGAFGARGITQAYNVARGTETGVVRWSPEFLDERVAAALVRYLAVAHFGRGRGEFVAGATPGHWQPAVAASLAQQHEKLQQIWGWARSGVASGTLEAELLPVMCALARGTLVRLYPESAPDLHAGEG